MATSVEEPEDHFPVFELSYGDSTTGQAYHVRSRQGKVFVRLANGGAFAWVSLRIVSTKIPLKLKYKCAFKRRGFEADSVEEGFEGDKCPQENALYIKKVAFLSKIYYRCWLTRAQHPDEFEQNPAGMFWCPSGQFCGAEEDDRWITALEIKMPPLNSPSQPSQLVGHRS